MPQFRRLSACCFAPLSFFFYRIFISDTHFVCRFFVCLIFTALPRRKSLLSIHAWTNIHATIPQIVGLLLRSAQFFLLSHIYKRHAFCVSLFCLLDFYCSTAPKIFAINSRMDKHSCHNSADCRLAASLRSVLFFFSHNASGTHFVCRFFSHKNILIL